MRSLKRLVGIAMVLALIMANGAVAAQEVIHEVKAGDTLHDIALRYGTSVSLLKTSNGLAGDTIYPGGQLVVHDSDQSDGASAIPWTVVNGLWRTGEQATVMDVKTGQEFKVVRRGGWAHADVEPATSEDTETLRQVYGGSWSWGRRPIVVTIDGIRVAGSMNGMPHGGQMVANNGFWGHHCMHFLGSTTHGTKRICKNHQQAVSEAVGN